MIRHPCISDNHSYRGCVLSCCYRNASNEVLVGCILYPRKTGYVLHGEQNTDVQREKRRYKIENKQERQHATPHTTALADTVLWYLHNSHLSITEIARRCDCSAQTVRKYRDRDEVINRANDDIENRYA